MVYKLSTAETFLYFIIWISATFYSLYKLYNVQTELMRDNSDVMFREVRSGWSILSRLKDNSDFEWTTWLFYFASSWPYLLLHVIVAEFIRKYMKHLLIYWYILSSLIYINKVFGRKQSLIIISQPIIFGIITFSGGNKASLWILCVSILLALSTLKYSSMLWYFFDYLEEEDEEINLLIIGLGWTKLRCLSYCFNYIDFWDKEKLVANVHESGTKRLFYNFINLFSYVLYLPTLYTGPIILYEDFEKTFVYQNVDIVKKLALFLKDIIIYAIYTVLFEVAFHYIYFLGMIEHIEFIRKMPAMALCGGGLWMGLQFHLKYVISYGTASAFARLDNIEPPPTPRCIARIHAYSQMWRYFDVGLYKFLIKHLYIPLNKVISKNTQWSKLGVKQAASFITYIFIFIWHDASFAVFIWASLNYIGISLEELGSIIMKTDRYKYFKENILRSDRMELRFKALVSTPLFALSAISSFYLFADYEVGNLFFKYSLQPSFWNFIIISTALYSCCHVSMYLQDVPSRTDTKRYVNLKSVEL